MVSTGTDSGHGPGTRKGRLLLIQVLRGLAAIFVVFYHATILSEANYSPYVLLSGLFMKGYAGVDFFFVLSGFIIAYAHFSDIGRKDRLRPFVLKRFLRLYPLYWIVSCLVVLAYFLIPGIGAGQEYVKEPMVIVRSLLLFPQPNQPVLSVAWTLVYEVLFYILFCGLILFTRKASRVMAIAWLALSALNCAGVSRWLFGFPGNYVTEYFFSGYNFEFLEGIVAALLVMNRRFGRFGAAFMVAGVILFILSCALLPTFLPANQRMLFYGIPFALLIMGAAAKDLADPPRVPGFLAYLGEASYSIFLVHLPSISLCYRVWNMLGFDVRFGYFACSMATIVVAVAGGCLFYSLVEKRVMKALRNRLLGP